MKVKSLLAPETPASCILTARPNWISQAQLDQEDTNSNILNWLSHIHKHSRNILDLFYLKWQKPKYNSLLNARLCNDSLVSIWAWKSCFCENSRFYGIPYRRIGPLSHPPISNSNWGKNSNGIPKVLCTTRPNWPPKLGCQAQKGFLEPGLDLVVIFEFQSPSNLNLNIQYLDCFSDNYRLEQIPPVSDILRLLVTKTSNVKIKCYSIDTTVELIGALWSEWAFIALAWLLHLMT